MISRYLQALFVGIVLAVSGGLLASCGGTSASAPAIPNLASELSGPLAECNAQKSDQVKAVACATEVWYSAVKGTNDVALRLPALDKVADRAGDLVALSCHSAMHEVGRRYASDSRVSLSSLQEYLPKTNNAGCSAGFAHGLLIDLGDDVVAAGPAKVSAVCHRYDTRYRVYSCVHGLGHAYSRFHLDLKKALRACAALPANDAPDCAQGAFHDYWFAVGGVDGTSKKIVGATGPRELCRGQRPDFVAGCWYRAYLEQPPRFPIREPADLARTCAGLVGVQREGCITAVNVIASPDPFEQLGGCALLGASDAAACIRGVAVQQLTDASLKEQVEFLEGCRRFPDEIQQGCVEWLGKLLAVVTNDRFTKVGCKRLDDATFRAWCAVGGGRVDEPLYTFS